MASRKDNLLRFKIALMKIQLKIRVRSGYIYLTVVETEHEKYCRSTIYVASKNVNSRLSS